MPAIARAKAGSGFALILIKGSFLIGINGLGLSVESYLQDCPQLLWRDAPALAAPLALIVDFFKFVLVFGPPSNPDGIGRLSCLSELL